MFCYFSMSRSSATKVDVSSNFTEFRVFGLVLVSIALNSAKLLLLSAFVALVLDMLQQQNIPFLKLQTFGDSGKKELTCYEYYFLLFEGSKKSVTTYVYNSCVLTFVTDCMQYTVFGLLQNTVDVGFDLKKLNHPTMQHLEGHHVQTICAFPTDPSETQN